jgi:hypothetical protein
LLFGRQRLGQNLIRQKNDLLGTSSQKMIRQEGASGLGIAPKMPAGLAESF